MTDEEYEVNDSEGLCPKCGAEENVYNDLEFFGENIYLRFTCGSCGCSYAETYTYCLSSYSAE